MTMTADSAERRHSLRLSGREDTKEPALPREAGKARHATHCCTPWDETVLQEHDSHTDRHYHGSSPLGSKCPAHVNTPSVRLPSAAATQPTLLSFVTKVGIHTEKQWIKKKQQNHIYMTGMYFV